jgi:glutamate synthase (NADPH) large chain
MPRDLPSPQGLYHPRFEHDSCGVNFVVHMKGQRSHEIVELGIGALCNLQHRGALGSEPNTGDGAGILLQMPDRFLRSVVDFDLPREGSYACGIAFLPSEPGAAAAAAPQVGPQV